MYVNCWFVLLCGLFVWVVVELHGVPCFAGFADYLDLLSCFVCVSVVAVCSTALC